MSHLSFNDLERLTQELSSMTGCQIPMPEGLRQLSESLNSGALKKISADLAASTEKGQSLAAGMRASSVTVPPEFIALVECAEISGDPRAIFDFAMNHARRIKRYRAELLTAMYYPLLSLIAMIVVFAFLANSAIPMMRDIFSQLGSELPVLTRITMKLSNAFHGTYGISLALGIIGLIIVASLVGPVRDFLFRLFMKIPGVEYLFSLGDTAIYMKILAVMLAKQVPLPIALRASSLAVMQAGMKRALIEMSEAADLGMPVSARLSAATPTTAAYLFRQAEERGNLPQACDGIANYCGGRFERLSANAVTIFEPALIVSVSLFIGIIVVSLYLPLFNIPKLIGR